MKKAQLFFILFLSPILFFGQKFKATYNRNIETYFLAEILSAEHRTINKDFELYKIKETSKYEPIVAKAIEKYGSLKSDTIAFSTAKINDVLMQKYGQGNDVLMWALVAHAEFPSRKWDYDYQFNNNNFSKEKNAEVTQLIKNYVNQLAKFYDDNQIDSFFKENKNFYKNASDEYEKNIPKNFVSAMENYYGEKFKSYTVLVSPMMMWPIEDGEGRGIGVSTGSGNQKNLYEIASPFVRVEKPNQFGYDNEFQARFLTVHEFGHSFVNKEVYEKKDVLEKFKILFENSNLKETMIKTGGYGDFQTCVAEHLVRLGEIEVAILQKDFSRAEKLRVYHLKNNFIFLPQLEEKIKIYNANRNQYKKFGDFVPQLLEVFNNSSIGFINEKLKK